MDAVGEVDEADVGARVMGAGDRSGDAKRKECLDAKHDLVGCGTRRFAFPTCLSWDTQFTCLS
jgi:hypothetical protein